MVLKELSLRYLLFEAYKTSSLSFTRTWKHTFLTNQCNIGAQISSLYGLSSKNNQNIHTIATILDNFVQFKLEISTSSQIVFAAHMTKQERRLEIFLDLEEKVIIYSIR